MSGSKDNQPSNDQVGFGRAILAWLDTEGAGRSSATKRRARRLRRAAAILNLADTPCSEIDDWCRIQLIDEVDAQGQDQAIDRLISEVVAFGLNFAGPLEQANADETATDATGADEPGTGGEAGEADDEAPRVEGGWVEPGKRRKKKKSRPPKNRRPADDPAAAKVAKEPDEPAQAADLASGEQDPDLGDAGGGDGNSKTAPQLADDEVAEQPVDSAVDPEPDVPEVPAEADLEPSPSDSSGSVEVEAAEPVDGDLVDLEVDELADDDAGLVDVEAVESVDGDLVDVEAAESVDGDLVELEVDELADDDDGLVDELADDDEELVGVEAAELAVGDDELADVEVDELADDELADVEVDELADDELVDLEAAELADDDDELVDVEVDEPEVGDDELADVEVDELADDELVDELADDDDDLVDVEVDEPEVGDDESADVEVDEPADGDVVDGRDDGEAADLETQDPGADADPVQDRAKASFMAAVEADTAPRSAAPPTPVAAARAPTRRGPTSWWSRNWPFAVGTVFLLVAAAMFYSALNGSGGGAELDPVPERPPVVLESNLENLDGIELVDRCTDEGLEFSLTSTLEERIFARLSVTFVDPAGEELHGSEIPRVPLDPGDPVTGTIGFDSDLSSAQTSAGFDCQVIVERLPN